MESPLCVAACAHKPAHKTHALAHRSRRSARDAVRTAPSASARRLAPVAEQRPPRAQPAAQQRRGLVCRGSASIGTQALRRGTRLLARGALARRVAPASAAAPLGVGCCRLRRTAAARPSRGLSPTTMHPRRAARATRRSADGSWASAGCAGCPPGPERRRRGAVAAGAAPSAARVQRAVEVSRCRGLAKDWGVGGSNPTSTVQRPPD